MLDIASDVKGEPFAARPIIVLALIDIEVVVTRMRRKFQHIDFSLSAVKDDNGRNWLPLVR